MLNCAVKIRLFTLPLQVKYYVLQHNILQNIKRKKYKKRYYSYYMCDLKL
jgi:hypothetical protein